MKAASRVILLRKSKILFIHRLKHGKEYYVLPGGSLEKKESPEEAARREIKEETNFDIKIDSLLWIIEEKVNDKLRKGYYFLAKQFSGSLKLGSPEAERQSEDNQYRFEWIALDRLDDFLIYPRGLKEKILLRFSG